MGPPPGMFPPVQGTPASSSLAQTLAEAAGAGAPQALGPPLALGASGLAATAAAGNAGKAQGKGKNDSEDMKLCKQMIVQLESRVRFLEAIILTKVIIPITFAPYITAMNVLRNYQAAASADPTGHGLGPPHPHMFYHFLEQLVLLPLDPGLDIGIKSRMLSMLLLAVQLHLLDAEAVDIFVPYFTIHQLGGGNSNKAMVTFHIRGTVALPAQEHVPEMTRLAMAAVQSKNYDEVMLQLPHCFTMEDSIPYAAARGHEIQRILLTLLSTLGGTKPAGRAPPGGTVKKWRGRAAQA